jgi:hypothetical protein
MDDETPKETILKPKARKPPVKQTEEARVEIAMRMRAINDKKIMDAAEKIRKEQEINKPVAPVPVPVPTPVAEPPSAPKIIRQKKFIKVIEITDDEQSDDEPPIIIKKKAKAKPLEETPAPPARKQRVTKPKEPVAPVIEIPRGRFL